LLLIDLFLQTFQDDYVLCQINRVRGKTETVEDNALKLEPMNVQLTFVEDHALKPEPVNVQQDVLTSVEDNALKPEPVNQPCGLFVLNFIV
jgi:hypothetical protein